jgi:hypothetical protein
LSLSPSPAASGCVASRAAVRCGSRTTGARPDGDRGGASRAARTGSAGAAGAAGRALRAAATGAAGATRAGRAARTGSAGARSGLAGRCHPYVNPGGEIRTTGIATSSPSRERRDFTPARPGMQRMSARAGQPERILGDTGKPASHNDASPLLAAVARRLRAALGGKNKGFSPSSPRPACAPSRPVTAPGSAQPRRSSFRIGGARQQRGTRRSAVC